MVLKNDNIGCSSGYLTEDEINGFQKLAKSVSHTVLSKDEAEEQGTRLIMMFELLLQRPIVNDYV